MTLLFSVLALTETIEHGALLPSAVVTFYCYWVNFSAMQSDPGQCNTLQNSDTDNTWYLIVGLIWAGLSVTYAGWNLASDKTLFGFDAEGSSETAVQHQPLYTAPDDTSDDYSAHGVDEAADVRMEQQDREEDAKEHAMEVSAHQGQQNIKFHLVMASCSMYMAMLLTDWGSRQQADDTMDSYDLSVQAMWIKIITEWLTGLLYMWTLVAPYLLPGRDFGYGGD
jgi:hypothetical protein